MSRQFPQKADTGSKASDDLLSEGHEGLRKIPDNEMIASYERVRDHQVQTGQDRTYPNIRRLHGTPFEREKDRREVRALLEKPNEMQAWYQMARTQPCTWWIKNHLVARHALKSCLACGVCTSQCPAAQYYEEYNPRAIVDIALSEDEARLVELLKSETLWYCGQCGSCKPKCSRENNLMGLISSLRFLAQLKGYHLASVRGRQQYAARHLWGGNLWNRACSLYFRNVTSAGHPDFGPRYADYHADIDRQMTRLGANPDSSGQLGGRKVPPETLAELRRCVTWGGTLVLWQRLEELALEDARAVGISIDEYHDQVRSEG